MPRLLTKGERARILLRGDNREETEQMLEGAYIVTRDETGLSKDQVFLNIGSCVPKEK